MKVLTKSNYVAGLECPRYLWNIFNHTEKIRKKTIRDEFRFQDGNRVTQIAKKLFPEGIDLPIDYKENLKESKIALKKKKTLFEAGFESNNCFSRADILAPVEDGWDIIEVKSAAKVKDASIHDVSFQKYVYEGNGLKIRKCFVLHINTNFVRNGDIEVDKLFKKEDITIKVDNEIKNVGKRIKEMFEMISSREYPEAGLFIPEIIKEGYHNCLLEGCIELPENNVFCLYRGKELACKLFKKGIEKIEHIADDSILDEKQKIQRECEIKNKVYIDKEKTKKFLETLKFPLYFLDFETFSTAIPMFDGLRPYSKVPFQFSLHIAENEKEIKHYEFLYDGNKDPREKFILALKKVIGDKGTVVVYNQSFEISRLNELAEYFPEHKKWIENAIKRIVDLIIPFREFSYYNPKQQGSNSLKDVLPALCGKSYDGMEINNGEAASAEFYNMAYGNGKNKEKTKENLLKYCGLDTLAEFMIIEKLKSLIQ